jgi:HEPN domain-containing protein
VPSSTRKDAQGTFHRSNSIRSNQNTRPDLSRQKSGLDLPQSHLEFIGKINNASVPTRYPEDLQRIVAQYPAPVARDYLEKSEEVLKWLKQHPNLQ